MRAVNLLPRDGGRAAKQAPKAVILVASIGAGLVFVGLAVGFLKTSGALSAKEQELAAKQSELVLTPRPEPKAVAEPSPFVGQRSPRVAAVNAALADRVAWDRLLRRFSLVLPDDIWLQTLSAAAPSAEGAAASPAGQGFTITGRTYSHDGVARLLKRLQALPDLENVQLQTSHLVTGGQAIVEFTIVAGVRSEGDSA